MLAAEIIFFNKSSTASPVDVVFFEPARFFDSQIIRLPWLIIQQCPHDYSHPFRYDFSLDMKLLDDWGNYSPPLKAQPGMRYVIRNVNGKEKLEFDGVGNNDEIEIFNDLPQGAPAIDLSRNGKTTAIRRNLVPGEFFSFRIPDTLLARKINGTAQASRLQQLENDNYCAQISMRGLQKADLLLTGGGNGSLAKKYSFTLENVNPNG